ncbi:protein ROOT INITIATION DEFECTIVE 3-like [Typha latifolia]|uniref:protein ROOT INITIATION DEFECTIVE 3-like n=1 Tax=Typha latifolia TaxID=4733 RepID=UPI003C2D208F
MPGPAPLPSTAAVLPRTPPSWKVEFVVMASSSSPDAEIVSWDLRSGIEQLRYRNCSSTRHGLISVGGRFIASSQSRGTATAATAPIFFWSWDKPKVVVRSFPSEPIGPLVSNSEGTYIIGGGSSGDIFLWEVVSGKLLNKWHAHYRSVSCLTLSGDESLLISGAVDGSIRVWSLMMMFDDIANTGSMNLYKYGFNEHTATVTDVVSDPGLPSVFISSSSDCTCKIWSLAEGTILRSIQFPTCISSMTMNPGKNAFYAGSEDGKIYDVCLDAKGKPHSSFGMSDIGILHEQRGAVTTMGFSTDGSALIFGSADGTVQIWDMENRRATLVLKHDKGSVNNVLIVKHPPHSVPPVSIDAQVSVSRKRVCLSLPPALSKYTDSTSGDVDTKAVTMCRSLWCDPLDSKYLSSKVLEGHVKELQEQSSSGAAELELERLRRECERSMQMAQQWKKCYQDLQKLYSDEILNDKSD